MIADAKCATIPRMRTTTLAPGLAPVITAIEKHAAAIHALGVTALYIYGSRARGDHRQDSDLDIMVEYDPAIFSLYDLVGVQHIIGDETGLETHVATRNAFRDTRRSEQDLVQVL